jgi:hypothetical protein
MLNVIVWIIPQSRNLTSQAHAGIVPAATAVSVPGWERV